MYGTVARLRLKEGVEAEMNRLLREFQALNVPGFIGEYVYRMDADPRECYMAVFFEDRAAYHANAQDPAQHARYQQMRALLDADPEWHDGEVIAHIAAQPVTG
jgi:quinol monooxygenase YgiN